MGASDEKVPKKPPEKESSRPTKQEKQTRATSGDRQPLAKPQESQLMLIEPEEVLSLKEQLKQEQEKSREYLNKLLYAQADFENYRKRLSQEVESRIETGKERLIQKLLSVVDELELTLNAAKNTEGTGAVAEGLEMVLKKFRDLLAAEGLTPIECVGKRFDPALHEAIERIQRDDVEDGTILEEVRKGFSVKGRLIRPSIVKIAVPHIAEPDDRETVEGDES
jgi:molecular chaperone GrpE